MTTQDPRSNAEAVKGDTQVLGTVMNAQPQMTSYTCPFCGRTQKAPLQKGKSIAFCMSCGKQVQLNQPEKPEQMVCPTCGRVQSMAVPKGKSFVFCMNCGQKIQLQRSTIPVSPEVPPSAASTDTRTVPPQETPRPGGSQPPSISFACPVCGRVQKTSLLEGKKYAFCINCGQRIQLNQATKGVPQELVRTAKEEKNAVHAYNGTDDYVFISYAHRNTDELMPVIKRMQEDGYHIWFDEGIDPGTEWDANIAEHVRHCSLMLAFLSKDYLASENCKDELNFARDIGKNRILVYLEDVTLPDGMAMRLNRLQAIHKYRYEDPEKFYEKLYASPDLISIKK